MFDQTQIGGLLHAEHVETIQALQQLENFLSRQGARKAPAVDGPELRSALEAVRAVAAEVERHFAFEENQLFALLQAQGEIGMVYVLVEEHAVIRPLAQDLAEQATAALAGAPFTAEAWAEFHERGLELAEREIFHIQKEEMGLLAAIAMLVQPDDDARLAEIYRRLTA